MNIIDTTDSLSDILCLRCKERPTEDNTFYCKVCHAEAKKSDDKRKVPKWKRDDDAKKTAVKHLRKVERKSGLTFSITMPSHVRNRLKIIASQQESKTIQDLINEACKQFIENYEGEDEI